MQTIMAKRLSNLPIATEANREAYNSPFRAPVSRSFNYLTEIPISTKNHHYRASDSPYSTTRNRKPERQFVPRERIVNNTEYIVDGELVLPEQITKLIDNKSYINRHKKLAREYGVSWLIKLSELAVTKGKPSRWYAKVTSVANWQQTEKMLMSLFRKLDQMKEKLQRIGVELKYLPYYLKAQSKLSEYKFNRCLENASSRGVNKRHHLFVKSLKMSLEELKSPQAKPVDLF